MGVVVGIRGQSLVWWPQIPRCNTPIHEMKDSQGRGSSLQLEAQYLGFASGTNGCGYQQREL